MRLSIAVSLLLSTLIFCVSASANENAESDDFIYLPNYRAECKDPDHCNYSAAVVLSRLNNGYTSECLGTLIGPATVLTAGHCVDQLWERRNGECSEDAYVIFPTRNGQQRQRMCTRITHFQSSPIQNGTRTADYAILELDYPVDRSPLPISNTPPAQNQIFQATHHTRSVISQDNTNINVFTLEQTQCRTIGRNIYNSDYDPENSNGIPTDQCELIHGDSGTGLISENGLTFGVLSQIHEHNLFHMILEAANSAIDFLDFAHIARAGSINIFFKTSCIDSTCLQNAESAEAATTQTNYFQEIHDQATTARIRILDNLNSEAQRLRNQGIRSRIHERSSQKRMTFTLTPECRIRHSSDLSNVARIRYNLELNVLENLQVEIATGNQRLPVRRLPICR